MKTAAVKYTRVDSLEAFLNAVSEEIRVRELEGYEVRFEILNGNNPSWELKGSGDVNVLVWLNGDCLEHIYSCSYRGLFSGGIFENNPLKQKFYEEFHKWVSHGKLRQLLTMYFSRTADASLDVALSQIESALTMLAKEGNLLLGNLDLIGKTRQEKLYVIEEVSKFANEESFVSLANRVRENIVTAKMCMFCKVLAEVVTERKSGGENV